MLTPDLIDLINEPLAEFDLPHSDPGVILMSRIVSPYFYLNTARLKSIQRVSAKFGVFGQELVAERADGSRYYLYPLSIDDIRVKEFAALRESIEAVGGNLILETEAVCIELPMGFAITSNYADDKRMLCVSSCSD